MFAKGVQDEGLVANVAFRGEQSRDAPPERQRANPCCGRFMRFISPAFKACVQEGGVKSVMSAYNKINGTACAMNPWL